MAWPGTAKWTPARDRPGALWGRASQGQGGTACDWNEADLSAVNVYRGIVREGLDRVCERKTSDTALINAALPTALISARR
jgi:hypothetical protein